MTQPHEAGPFLPRPDAANLPNPAQAPVFSRARRGMLQHLAAAGIALGAATGGLLTSGCGDDSEEPYSLGGDGGSDSHTDACGNNCGQGTHCNEVTKKCDPNTDTSDPCGGNCGPGTTCNTDTKKCDPVTAKYAGITWNNSNPGSGNGWSDTLFSADKDHPLGTTAWFDQNEAHVADCFVGYGSGTVLTLNGSGEWWNIQKSWLAAQTGHSTADTAYFSSKQASKDATAELMSYRLTPQQYRPANAFIWRAAGSNNSWTDSQALGSGESQIHCTFVPNNGVVEHH